MTHFRVMETVDFISSEDDEGAAEPWQAIGDIVNGLVRNLLAEARGRESAARGGREEETSPRTLPVIVGRRSTGEDHGGDDHCSRPKR
ncbi:MAG: hypothetical protein IPK85_02275 [Gemmatimonadetes bacterium]|nr:hypothetical protein [Gemmatimonadota bacterium]